MKKVIQGRFSYMAFQPMNLQDVTLTYAPDIVALVGEARAALATLKASYETLPEEEQREFQDAMLETEVTASLQLAVADKNKTDFHWLSRALPYAFSELEHLPISRRLLTAVHDMALHDLSHYKQNPGEFRRSPIWMGKKKATLTKGADFVPPAPEDMVTAFAALEHYINEEEDTEPLIKAALIHYQFEMIHPFLDGNGRVGRILTLLCLKEADLLPAPLQSCQFLYHFSTRASIITPTF
ncbi:Fic family protein [uncultured Mitsuokella sp.]|uniref:Fic family protein n=1 Tax=uncultured Mitsuokella sp. TaxID=453120 RepID=UPI0025D5CF24|nr:Fic family protein [uncultured Mitsuokella sp.]